MTLNGVMTVTLRHFTELATCVPTHNRVDLWRDLCTSLLYFVVGYVYDVVVKKVRSLSHLLMSFVFRSKTTKTSKFAKYQACQSVIPVLPSRLSH